MVSALVMGSAANPYKVEIEIKPLSRTQWQAIMQQCEGNLKSLQDCWRANFPRPWGRYFSILTRDCSRAQGDSFHVQLPR
jgi:hypothetical protein